MAAALTLLQAVAAEVAPTGQCGGKGGGGEGGSPPAGGAVRGAGARVAPAPSPPAPGAGTGHHLPVGDGAGEDGDEGGAGGAEQRSSAGQWCGTGRRRKGQAEERSEAKGLQGKKHGRAGLHEVGGKGHGAIRRQGKGQGKESGHGYVGSPVFPGNGLGCWGGVVPPPVPPIVPPFLPQPYLAMGMVYPPLLAYQGMQPQAHMQQRKQAGGTALGAQEGKGEEHRRAWERLGEAERSLREGEVRVKGEVGGAEEGRTEGTDRPQGGEAQAVEELQMAWADLWRREEGVERA